MNEDIPSSQSPNVSSQDQSNINPVPASAGNTPLPFYRKDAFIIPMVIFLPPIGIAFMWLWSLWKDGIKILFTVLLIPMMFVALIFWVIAVTVVQRVIAGEGLSSYSGQQTSFDKKRDLEGEKKQMLDFLQSKYSKDFTFKSGKFEDTASLGLRFTTFRAELSPVDDPSLNITASKLTSGFNLSQKSTDPDYRNYVDSYPEALWTRQESETIKEFLISEFGYLPQHDLKVHMLGGINNDLYLRTPKAPPLVFNELPANIKSSLSYILVIDLEGEILKTNIADHAQRIIDINDYAMSRGVGELMITYTVHKDLVGIDNDTDHNVRYEWQGVGNHRVRGIKTATDTIPYFTRLDVNEPLRYYNPSKGEYEVSSTPFRSNP